MQIKKKSLEIIFYIFCPWVSAFISYNHDNARDEKEMEELEVNYLSKLKIKIHMKLGVRIKW